VALETLKLGYQCWSVTLASVHLASAKVLVLHSFALSGFKLPLFLEGSLNRYQDHLGSLIPAL